MLLYHFIPSSKQQKQKEKENVEKKLPKSQGGIIFSSSRREIHLDLDKYLDPLNKYKHTHSGYASFSLSLFLYN